MCVRVHVCSIQCVYTCAVYSVCNVHVCIVQDDKDLCDYESCERLPVMWNKKEAIVCRCKFIYFSGGMSRIVFRFKVAI